VRIRASQELSPVREEHHLELPFLVESRQMTALATASVIIASGISQRTGACCRVVRVVTAYPSRQAGHGPSQ
jgi:hypothetical protein